MRKRDTLHPDQDLFSACAHPPPRCVTTDCRAANPLITWRTESDYGCSATSSDTPDSSTSTHHPFTSSAFPRFDASGGDAAGGWATEGETTFIFRSQGETIGTYVPLELNPPSLLPSLPSLHLNFPLPLSLTLRELSWDKMTSTAREGNWSESVSASAGLCPVAPSSSCCTTNH